MLALCQSVSRETHKIRQSGSSVRVGDAQFHQIHRSTALHELVLAPSLTPQAPAALASDASLFTPLKATGTVTIPYLTNHRQLLQRIVLLLGILVLCRALKLVLGH